MMLTTFVRLSAVMPSGAMTVTKLWSVLDGMLTPEERESLLRAVREGG